MWDLVTLDLIRILMDLFFTFPLATLRFKDNLMKDCEQIGYMPLKRNIKCTFKRVSMFTTIHLKNVMVTFKMRLLQRNN